MTVNLQHMWDRALMLYYIKIAEKQQIMFRAVIYEM
jgi:hypothetical protein